MSRGHIFALALTALAIVLLAASYMHWPSEKVPALETNKAASDQRKSKPSERGTEQVPLVVRIVPTQQDPKRAEAERAEKQEKAVSEHALVWATVALAVFTFALAGFTAYLWSATSELVGDARDNATHQLRAYVSGTPFWIHDFSTTTSVQIKYKVENHGQTPAYGLRNTARIEIFPWPLPETFEFPSLPLLPQKTLSLQPRQQITSTVTADRLFTEQEIHDATTGNGCRIFCYGIIRYRDSFENDRTTRFCTSVMSGGGTNDLLVLGTTGLPENYGANILFFIDDKHNEAT